MIIEGYKIDFNEGLKNINFDNLRKALTKLGSVENIRGTFITHEKVNNKVVGLFEFFLNGEFIVKFNFSREEKDNHSLSNVTWGSLSKVIIEVLKQISYTTIAGCPEISIDNMDFKMFRASTRLNNKIITISLNCIKKVG